MKPEIYRQVIDSLVEVCHQGQGSIGSERVLRGVWNADVDEELFPEEHAMNRLLSKLSLKQRKVLAKILKDQFISGVFESLKALEVAEIEPFLDGYEGSPFHDFIGRVADDPWPWPTHEQ